MRELEEAVVGFPAIDNFSAQCLYIEFLLQRWTISFLFMVTGYLFCYLYVHSESQQILADSRSDKNSVQSQEGSHRCSHKEVGGKGSVT